MTMIHAHASRPARQTDNRAFAAVTERNDGEPEIVVQCRSVPGVICQDFTCMPGSVR